MALDILGRQLFISCKDDDVSGSVHVWRLHDVTNDYVGVIIDKRTDIATGAVPSPRAIAIFPQLKFVCLFEITYVNVRSLQLSLLC